MGKPYYLYQNWEGWLYLTVIMDLADRKMIGWSMDNSMNARSTVVDAWKMAIKIGLWRRNSFSTVTGESNMPATSSVDALRDYPYCKV